LAQAVWHQVSRRSLLEAFCREDRMVGGLQALKARFTGASNTVVDADRALCVELTRITSCGVMDIPKELRAPIVEKCGEEDARKIIMKHLQECLAEPKAQAWRRIHASLILVEDLFSEGSQDLLSETAGGLHFDVVQRLALLERYEVPSDRRAQQILRQKAQSLRVKILPLLQAVDPSQAEAATNKMLSADATHAEASANKVHTEDRSPTCARETESVGSFGTEGTCSTAASFSALPQPAVIGGIVKIGHNDDTTSESSAAEDQTSKTSKKVQRRMTARERGERQEPTPQVSGTSTPVMETSSPTPAPTLSCCLLEDLLDFTPQVQQPHSELEKAPAMGEREPPVMANLLDF